MNIDEDKFSSNRERIEERMDLYFGESEHSSHHINDSHTETKTSGFIEHVKSIFGFIFALAVAGGLIFSIHTCNIHCAKNQAVTPKSKYIATCGSFFGYDLYKFHTYKFVDGRYVLYDESENVVGDILVTGNNRLEIKLRR